MFELIVDFFTTIPLGDYILILLASALVYIAMSYTEWPLYRNRTSSLFLVINIVIRKAHGIDYWPIVQSYLHDIPFFLYWVSMSMAMFFFGLLFDRSKVIQLMKISICIFFSMFLLLIVVFN